MGASTGRLARRSFLSRGVALGLAPQVFDAEQALRFQPRVGQCLLQRRGSRRVPPVLAADAMLDRRLQAHAQIQQVANLRAHPAPLFPVAHAQSPSDPVIQFRHWPVILAEAQVRRPPCRPRRVAGPAALLANGSPQQAHQHVVIDRIEELGQVDVHRDASAVLHARLHLPDRLVCVAAWSETEAWAT